MFEYTPCSGALLALGEGGPVIFLRIFVSIIVFLSHNPATVLPMMTQTVFPHSEEYVLFTQADPTPGQRPRGGVRQDKGMSEFARVASKQPAPDTNGTRAHTPGANSSRSQNPSLRGKAVKVTLWVKPIVKAELERVAHTEHLSLSKVGGVFLEEAIRQDIHRQHETLLYPVIRQIIREELRAFGNRLVFFLMRIAFAAEQSRILITNILDRTLRRDGVPEKTFTTLLDQSNKMARRNIIHKTPQIAELLDEWEDSFKDIREEGTSTHHG